MHVLLVNRPRLLWTDRVINHIILILSIILYLVPYFLIFFRHVTNIVPMMWPGHELSCYYHRPNDVTRPWTVMLPPSSQWCDHAMNSHVATTVPMIWPGHELSCYYHRPNDVTRPWNSSLHNGRIICAKDNRLSRYINIIVNRHMGEA